MSASSGKNTGENLNTIRDEPTPRPVTEQDIADAKKKMASLNKAQIDMLCNTYVQQLKGIITNTKKKLDNRKDEEELAELDHIMHIISLCPADELFIRSKDKIWHARFRILNQDADWFLNRDYSASIKKDQKQVMIETIIKMAQYKFVEMSKEEQESYWMKAIEMLNIVSQFKKLTGEF
jgi:hypothetical protein